MSTPEHELPSPRARLRWRLLVVAIVVAVGMALGPALLVARLAAGPGAGIDARPMPAASPAGGVSYPVTATAAAAPIPCGPAPDRP